MRTSPWSSTLLATNDDGSMDGMFGESGDGRCSMSMSMSLRRVGTRQAFPSGDRSLTTSQTYPVSRLDHTSRHVFSLLSGVLGPDSGWSSHRSRCRFAVTLCDARANAQYRRGQARTVYFRPSINMSPVRLSKLPEDKKADAVQGKLICKTRITTAQPSASGCLRTTMWSRSNGVWIQAETNGAKPRDSWWEEYIEAGNFQDLGS